MKKYLLPVLLLAATSVSAEELKHAQVMLMPLKDGNVAGLIKFSEVAGGGVEVKGDVVGLKPSSKHGFHVHEFGDCTSPEGLSAGGHFKMADSHHGGPDAKMRHLGDLGNVEADAKGTALINTTDKMLSLSGANSIIGRSVVVHDGEDDLKTDPAGNSGARVGCGVIGISK